MQRRPDAMIVLRLILCMGMLFPELESRVNPSGRKRGPKPYISPLQRHHSGPHICQSGFGTTCCPGWTFSTTSGLCLIPICSFGCGKGYCTAPNVCSCQGGRRGVTCPDEGHTSHMLTGNILSRSNVEGGATLCLTAQCDHSCALIGGLPACSCSLGYSLGKDGRSCYDVDECSRYGGMVLCQQLCKNTMGSFRCQCYPGYQLSANGRSCVIVPLFLEPTGCGEYGCDLSCSPSGCEQISRVCPVGFIATETSSRVTCTDIDECAGSHSACQHRCQNSVGSYKCSCRPGFYLHANGHTCIDFNECQRKRDKRLCQQSCQNTIGSFTCFCRPGYRLSADRVNCEDVDECREDVSLCPGRCRNTRGSYRCSCPEGFTQVGNNCQDFDECHIPGPSLCQQGCLNTAGSYMCACRRGYRLKSDGHTCADINECHLHPSRCMHHCENLIGSYRCACPVGYRLLPDGKRCEDQNECEETSHGCAHRCENTAGSYRCLCHRGFRLTDQSVCEDVNECAQPNASHCTHSCINTIGSYLCGCRHGYRLHIDKKSCIVDSHHRRCPPGFVQLSNGVDCTVLPDSILEPSALLKSMPYLKINKLLILDSQMKITGPPTSPPPSDSFSTLQSSPATHLKLQETSSDFLNVQTKFRTPVTSNGRPTTYKTQPTSTLENAGKGSKITTQKSLILQDEFIDPPHIIQTTATDHHIHLTKEPVTQVAQKSFLTSAPFHTAYIIHPTSSTMTSDSPNSNIRATVSVSADKQVASSTPFIFEDVKATLKSPSSSQDLPIHPSTLSKAQTTVISPVTSHNMLQNSLPLTNAQTTNITPLTTEDLPPNLPILMNIQDLIATPSSTQHEPSNTPTMFKASATSPPLNNVQVTLNTPLMSQSMLKNLPIVMDTQSTISNPSTSEGTPSNTPTLAEVQATLVTPPESQETSLNPTTLYSVQATLKASPVSQGTYPNLPVVRHVESTTEVPTPSQDMTSDPLTLDNGQSKFMTPTVSQDTLPALPVIMHVQSTISADPMDKVMTSHSLPLDDVFITPSTGQAMPPHSPISISLSAMQTTPTSFFSLEEGLEISPTGQNSFRTPLHLHSTYTVPPVLLAMPPNSFIDYEDSFIHPSAQSKLPSPLPLQAALKSPNTWHTSTGLPALIKKSRTSATLKSILESPTSTQTESKTHLILQKTSTNLQSSHVVSPSTQHTAFTPVTITQPNSHPTVSLIMRTSVPTLIGSTAIPSSAVGVDSTTLMSSPSVLSQRSPLSSNSDHTPSTVLDFPLGTSSVLTVSSLDYMGLFLAQKQSEILKPSSYIPTKTRSETSPTESSKPPLFNYKFPPVSPNFQRSDLKTTASMSSLNSSPVNKQSSTRSNVAITQSDTSFSSSPPSRPTLKSDPAPIVCLHNGVLHPEGSNWLESQCKDCSCLEGNVFCSQVSCSVSCSHPVLDEDHCCPLCSRCSYHGLIIENEETFSPEEDNCTLCLCLAGNVTCLSPECPLVTCAQPIQSDCCPVCPVECIYEGAIYQEGAEFPKPGDDCSVCVCQNGEVVCSFAPCPVLDCPRGDWVLETGQCCFSCRQTAVQKGCSVDDNGTEFPVGQIWSTGDPCETCVCQLGGIIVCQRTECQEICPHPIKIPGQCCPVCSVGCTYGGIIYENNETFPSSRDPCLTCVCLSGSVACSSVHCRPNCTYPFHQEGECCPLCQDCNFEGRKVYNGQSFSLENRPCTQCTCQYGEVECVDLFCSIDCSHPLHLPEECCPTCQACFHDGRVLDDGDYYISETDPCTVCFCTEGNIQCEWKGDSCPPVICESPLQHQPGQCCPLCPGGHIPVYNADEPKVRIHETVTVDKLPRVLRRALETRRKKGAIKLSSSRSLLLRHPAFLKIHQSASRVMVQKPKEASESLASSPSIIDGAISSKSLTSSSKTMLMKSLTTSIHQHLLSQISPKHHPTLEALTTYHTPLKPLTFPSSKLPWSFQTITKRTTPLRTETAPPQPPLVTLKHQSPTSKSLTPLTHQASLNSLTRSIHENSFWPLTTTDSPLIIPTDTDSSTKIKSSRTDIPAKQPAPSARGMKIISEDEDKDQSVDKQALESIS
ncbi:uncharacterized protein LOC114645883 isoform X1 [Erpetoichthys calabaricus]|uniref:uncharacterized protein LOC114645883 isoform X1 n=1 Tax=Erpetoichthys calabaricus TaxID=27687 RepID=UPI00109F559B|nr:uncharacterized protein LOC114645883 isoform X1 [Erpetoichthys calabaricus]XP_028649616.1 uncharacterized protein LOC114645883 isoform X1 [Erpetoichthys calabaricus]XP_028649617.1 uncharacterized protein LOC114645883 isoform X1 [Erpetoichthys calabaricus]